MTGRLAVDGEAVYSYLPPGHYNFLLMSKDGDNDTAANISRFSFTIEAPFWKTPWFYGILLLLVIALVYWTDSGRRKRKAVLQKMRSHISDNLHQEVSEALQDINVLSEIARLKASTEPEQSVNYINEIHHKSSDMILAMDDMLWSINPENDSMEKIIERARQHAASLSHVHGVNIEVRTDKIVKQIKPEMNVRHELILIYKLALRLMVEELHAKQTTAQFIYIKNQLQLSVYAAGCTPDDHQYQLQSIAHQMKERAATIDGNLEVFSDEKGTGVLLSLRE